MWMYIKTLWTSLYLDHDMFVSGVYKHNRQVQGNCKAGILGPAWITHTAHWAQFAGVIICRVWQTSASGSTTVGIMFGDSLARTFLHLIPTELCPVWTFKARWTKNQICSETNATSFTKSTVFCVVFFCGCCYCSHSKVQMKKNMMLFSVVASWLPRPLLKSGSDWTDFVLYNGYW